MHCILFQAVLIKVYPLLIIFKVYLKNLYMLLKIRYGSSVSVCLCVYVSEQE